MRILLIGTGFIGSQILQTLSNEGHEVSIFSKSEKDYSKFHQIVGDISDKECRVQALRCNPEVVIQTAWISKAKIYKNHPSNFDYSSSTIDLARDVLSTSAKHFIVLGSCSEYGLPSTLCHAGKSKLSPLNLYAQQKVRAFLEIRKILANSHVKFSWPRIFYPYGPNQDPQRLIPQLIKAYRERSDFILDDISSVYDWISTRDVASAISWLINHDLPTELDIGSGIGFTNPQVQEAIEKRFARSGFVGSHPKSGVAKEFFVVDKKSPLFDSGWRPSDTIQSGIDWLLNS